jgi:hypothetical protein
MSKLIEHSKIVACGSKPTARCKTPIQQGARWWDCVKAGFSHRAHGVKSQ